MATSNVSDHSQPTGSPLAGVALALVVGYGWGAVMLFTLGFWMRSKYGVNGQALTYIFLGAGVASLGLAIWQGFTLWFKNETPEQKNASLDQQVRLSGFLLPAAGLGLIVLAFILGMGKNSSGNYAFLKDNLGESIGVLLFGLIAVGGGYFLGQINQPSTVSPVQFLADKAPLLKLIQIVLGLLALGLCGYVAYTNRTESRYVNWLPELAALLFTSILCFACLMWLNSGKLDEFGIRLFVLVFGGSLGFILFCYAVARAIVWRQDIFLGGIASWQGENGWHGWMCVYLQFVALILMFGSFNLARTDIRTNAYLRRVMYGYDAVVQGLLLLQMLAVMNMTIYALYPFTFDWTKSRGAYALSDSSKNMISNLKQDANVFVLMSQNDPAFRDLRNLMDNCQALSNRFKVNYVAPDMEPAKYRELAEIFPKLQPDSPMSGGRGVLLVFGAVPENEKHTTPYAFISDRKLSEEDHSARRTKEGKSKRIFKGEEEIMKEFKFLSQGQKKRKVYFLQGNDEPDVANDQMAMRRSYRDDLSALGFGALVDRLKKDNMEVSGLSFTPSLAGEKRDDIVEVKEEGADKKKDVPTDCETLIASIGSKTLPKTTIDAIERYMDRGGKMLVFLDVVADKEFGKLINTGLEPLLKSFGVEVSDEYAIAVRSPLETNEANILTATAASKSEHVLARQFVGRSISMKISARPLVPSEAPGRFKAEAVLQLLHTADQRAIVEKDVKFLGRDLNRYVLALAQAGLITSKLSAKPVTVAVAVSEVANNPGDMGKPAGEGKPRLVVVGDTEFITNVDLRVAKSQLNHYSFAASALEWMAERDSIGASPKTVSSFSIDDSVNTTRMILVPGWIMLLLLIGSGVAIWVVRRR